MGVVLDARLEAVVARRALAGAGAAELVEGLVAEGVGAEVAAAVVASVLTSPILAGAREAGARGRAVEQAARLVRAVDPEPLAEVSALDEATLYREHWTANRPVVFRGAAAGWPAARWTFADLGARFRWAPLDVVERGPRWWTAPRRTRRMAFGDFVSIALGAPSDALYADGRSAVLDQAGLASLRADLGPLPGLAGDGHPRAWIGPAGTVTPTHHDLATGWLAQLVGRKRLWLASPLESALQSTRLGLFSHVDPREPPAPGELAEVRWHAVELAPGDALLTPVGWWHHAEALTPSISVSFSGFRWPNAHPWYLPE